MNKIKPQDEPGFVVAVDQAFTVKGVGLVAIGHVQSGKLNKHNDNCTPPIAIIIIPSTHYTIL